MVGSGHEGPVLWDVDNPRSLINMVTPVFKRNVLEAKEAFPDLFLMSESELFKTLSRRKQRPSTMDHRLRTALWLHYDEVTGRNLPTMKMSHMCRGVMTEQQFNHYCAKYQYRLSWLLCVPHSYYIVLKEMLNYGVDHLRKILDLPFTTKHPKTNKIMYNTRLMELQAKIIFAVEQRLMGSIPLKIESETKNLNLNLHHEQVKLNEIAEQHSMEQIEKRLNQLEKQKTKLSKYKKENTDIEEADIISDNTDSDKSVINNESSLKTQTSKPIPDTQTDMF